MLAKSEPVSVSLIYDKNTAASYPRSIVWNRRLYKVSKVGLHHTYKKGDTLFHVFSVVSDTVFFRLILDTKTLHWSLSEIADSLIS